jgi:Protein of unknown function (DUF1460)
MSWVLVALWVVTTSTPTVTANVDLPPLKSLPLNARVAQVSQGFLSVKYAFSPLGEGTGASKDGDPLISYQAVDCLTYVETTMALALSESPAEVLSTLNAIRYANGTPDWNFRNHLTEAQWIPNNIAKGFLKDVTAQYAGSATRQAVKVLSAESYRLDEGKSLDIAPAQQPLGRFAWPMVPAAQAMVAFHKAPTGTIVVVIRADLPRRITRVSHLGILIQSKNGPLLRHASKSFRKVIDEPLDHYLKRNLDFAAWTISGFSLLQVAQPSP